MDIDGKLRDLRKMHDEGLITTAVYEEQQRSLLQRRAGGVEDASQSVPHSSFLDPQANLSALGKVAVAIVAVVAVCLGGVWLVYHISDRQGKDTINQMVSLTGVGTQVIPWSDRTETAARNLIDRNKQNIANAVRRIIHPTGKDAALQSINVSKYDDHIVVEMQVEWKGGFTGGAYTTSIAWDVGKTRHIVRNHPCVLTRVNSLVRLLSSVNRSRFPLGIGRITVRENSFFFLKYRPKFAAFEHAFLIL